MGHDISPTQTKPAIDKNRQKQNIYISILYIINAALLLISYEVPGYEDALGWYEQIKKY